MGSICRHLYLLTMFACINTRCQAVLLQRNVSLNCVGVVVFQPRASAWVQLLCGCSGVMWGGMTEQAPLHFCLPTGDYLAPAGWSAAVQLREGERVNKHKSPFFLRVHLCWCSNCTANCMCLMSLSICVCLSLFSSNKPYVGLCGVVAICAC